MISSYTLTVLTLMGIWSVAALGLNVITGYAGQFNLGIGVYMGTGAYATAILTTQAGVNFWLALPCALLISAAMGFLTGLPALRVREDALAVFTIGLVFVFESLLIYLPYFGGPVGIGRIPYVGINGSQLSKEGYLALVLVALGAVVAATIYLRRAWMGLAWASIRENELATNTIGIHSARFKLYAFTIGATFAGLAGVLYAHFIHYVTPYDFGFLPSIYILVMIVFGGLGTIRGAIFGACFLTLMPELFRFIQDYRNLIYGAMLVGLMLFEPNGVLGDESYVWRLILSAQQRLNEWLNRVSKSRRAYSISAAATNEIRHKTPNSIKPASRKILETRNLTRRFGGLVAVNDVNLEVFSQEILGIIGPNGAGKTTFFNLLSGTIPCTSGEIRLNSEPIHRLSPHLIAQRGIGRTFQIVRPFSQLSVLDNVLAGISARYCKGFADSLRQYRNSSDQDEAHLILEQTGLLAHKNEVSRNLPLGLLRRLEIARALGLRPNLILLDESFSGLSHRESQSLIDLVRMLRENGATIMLIEHNMQVTMKICDRIAVLNYGNKIAEGMPEDIRNHPTVIAAYLGSAHHA
ncbi:MAG TPA: branched-chain amino acid ABC transporter ATP-binding protein/permease [Pseudolabrys sp.]|nr:branched-chain amino acid ABC transporter ATP-binding protein/permease [Pseudolabrys sp.]